MPATTSQKKSASASADKTAKPGVQDSPAALTDSESRADVLNRLRRAEGQLRGIQRMIEDGESCLKIGQQFSAVRKALDSTYLRMTVCFMAQELESRLTPDEEQKTDLSAMMKDVETLLARMG
jgi:CsoR family transcriptional regulator, copper-sensing transcriptional repressor